MICLDRCLNAVNAQEMVTLTAVIITVALIPVFLLLVLTDPCTMNKNRGKAVGSGVSRNSDLPTPVPVT